jgi:putative alpha-1,2-mannosidase
MNAGWTTGNEDAGQMSAWYVLSSMGFYPVNPANSIYVLGSPRFEEVEITLPGEKSFNIRAEKMNDQNLYIKSVKLNGEPLKRSSITHDDIVSGGEMIFEMGSSPNKEWAKKEDQRPPNIIYNN